MHGSDRVPDLTFDYERACGVAKADSIKSKMALFSECTPQYALKLFDTADIVRDAIFHQLRDRFRVVDDSPRSSFVANLGKGDVLE
jgi:hypothetical protein